MIDLAPIPTARHRCPGCGRLLDVRGFHVPGMRCLAELECAPCHRRFYGDLPSGHGLYYPALLDRETGEVFGSDQGAWFARWMRESYRNRTSDPVPLEVERLRPAENVLVLDCLDGIYGHALLKLLNAQVHLDRHVGMDLLVLVPRFLHWMVPAGVAEIWTLDLPLRGGARWNEWLAGRVAERLAGRKARLSLATCLPHPRDYAIERFTGVAPFAAERWADIGRPVVTFVLRDDRPWGEDPHRSRAPALRRMARRVGLSPSARSAQLGRVVRFGRALRRRWPELDLAVAGIGEPGGLPGWIRDLRLPRPSAEEERGACRRFAASHLVVGVHGSNMLLPSAHAGATLEIAWGPNLVNAVQDLLVREDEPRIALFRYRILSPGVGPGELAAVADSMLRAGAQANRFAATWNDHDRLSRAPFALADGAWCAPTREPDADGPGSTGSGRPVR